MACRSCRLRKVKCDRTRPSCKNCMQRGNECSYEGERRKRQKLNNSGAEFLLDDPDNNNTALGPWSRTPDRPSPLASCPSQSRHIGDAISLSSSVDSASCTDPVRVSVPAAEPTTHPPRQGTLLDQILDGNDADPLQDGHAAIWMRTNDAEEYSGPSSGIAAMSDLGLKWISTRVPDSDELCRTIQYVRDGLLTHLRQCIPSQPLLRPEATWKALPPPETVREYVDTYFSTVQTVFPVIDAALFNEMLARWYDNPSSQSDSWKALLNAVLASGCRAALSNGTASAFHLSSTQAWGFFQNALNYEPKLVHSATDLVSVQALVVMTVFAQGMSSSQRLEYTLCSTAARLAHSLALHRHVPKHWGMSEREQRERQRLFWVIYCLDKSIALRSGRPSVIHDDDISCPFPRDVRYGIAEPEGPAHTDEERPFDMFLCLVKLYRICSLVGQHLYSTLALCQPTFKLRITAAGILTRLETWRESIPARFRPGQPLSRLPVGSSIFQMQVLVLHFCYYYAICAVHRRFTPMFLQGDEPDYAGECSPQGWSAAHIEAARSMALLTKYLDVESYTPAWLLFYYPATALATIFMHTVTTPLSASAQSDVALMEAVAGFFGRLEYMTSGEAAFTKTSEFARQARLAVAKAVNQNQHQHQYQHHAPDHPPSDHRPCITIHPHNAIDATPTIQPTTTLDPIPSTYPAPERTQEPNRTGPGPQGTDAFMNDSQKEGNPGGTSDFGDTLFSSLCNNIMASGVNLASFEGLSDGYWPDELFAATRLDVV